VYALGLTLPALLGMVVIFSGAQNPAASQVKPEPVEKDMHEFMEYVFQPTYQRLKQSMASEPADDNRWKGIKSDALILAEGGNLLLARMPDEDAKSWNEHSVAVRDFGGKLYAAAKKKDFKSARREYETMLTNCNRCHTAFAAGEYQLKP
jgi:hypothetical protein